MVDGIIYFDRDADKQMQDNIAVERARIIQKMIAAKKTGDKTIPATPSVQELNMCEEDHGHGRDLWERIAQRMIEIN